MGITFAVYGEDEGTERLIPFDTYNVLYRDRLEADVLAPLRAELEPQRHGP